jgi:hypothetical protein
MTPELWQRLKPLYDLAISLPGPEQEEFVASSCGEDKELRDALRRLITANLDPTDTFDAPLVDLGALLANGDYVFQPGEIVGERFTITRLIGSGGMGDVYEAQDQVLGRIALKTIRSLDV